MQVPPPTTTVRTNIPRRWSTTVAISDPPNLLSGHAAALYRHPWVEPGWPSIKTRKLNFFNKSLNCVCEVDYLTFWIQGQPVCSYYSLYGICKYGPGCKYDHPVMVYSYNYPMGMNMMTSSVLPYATSNGKLSTNDSSQSHSD